MKLGRVVKTKGGKLRIAFRDKVRHNNQLTFVMHIPGHCVAHCILCNMQEMDNLYGMFRIRGSLHQKAYQHKTSKAVEQM